MPDKQTKLQATSSYLALINIEWLCGLDVGGKPVKGTFSHCPKAVTMQKLNIDRAVQAFLHYLFECVRVYLRIASLRFIGNQT
jgi:hypothetical protein